MIEVRELTKRYGARTVVDRLTFDVYPGKVTGLLGPNGSGKSTTMRAVLGLETPTSGEAVINGRRYADIRRPMHMVGSLLDASALPGGRRAFNHLTRVARRNGIGPRRVVSVLEQAGLAGAARQRIRRFSLGMRQRLGIAAALLGDPEVLVLDEPMNGLDSDGMRWLRGLLRSMAAEGRTILLSGRAMDEMARTADVVLVVSHGRLLEELVAC